MPATKKPRGKPSENLLDKPEGRSRAVVVDPKQLPLLANEVVYGEERPETLFDPEQFEKERPWVRTRIQRVDDQSKQLVMHGYLEPAETTEGRVAELFGGGKYVLSAMIPNLKGGQAVKASLTIVLPGPYKPPVGELPGIAKAVPLGSPGVQDVVAVQGLGRIPANMSMREMVEAGMANQLLALVEKSRQLEQPRVDYMPLFTALITGLTPVLAKLVERDKGSPELAALRELIQTVQQEVRTLKTQPGPASSAIGDAVKAIKELLEVRDMISGDTEDPDTKMWEMGTKALEALTQQPTQPKPLPASTGGPEMQPWQRLLLHYRPRLIEAAQRSIDADFVAEMIVRYLPERAVGVLEEFLKRSDAVLCVSQVIPEMQAFPAWTERLIAELRKLDEAAPEEESEKE